MGGRRVGVRVPVSDCMKSVLLERAQLHGMMCDFESKSGLTIQALLAGLGLVQAQTLKKETRLGGERD